MVLPAYTPTRKQIDCAFSVVSSSECPPDWVDNEVIINAYCAKNGDDPLCLRTCKEGYSCIGAVEEYCQGGKLGSDACITYCFKEPFAYDCTANLLAYCKDSTDPVCDCFHDESYYHDRRVTDLVNLGLDHDKAEFYANLLTPSPLCSSVCSQSKFKPAVKPPICSRIDKCIATGSLEIIDTAILADRNTIVVGPCTILANGEIIKDGKVTKGESLDPPGSNKSPEDTLKPTTAPSDPSQDPSTSTRSFLGGWTIFQVVLLAVGILLVILLVISIVIIAL